MNPKVTDIRLAAVADIDIEAAGGEATARPRFTIVAYNGGAIRPLGFARPVVIDLSGLRATSTVPILLEHDRERVIGQADEVTITPEGVRLRGIITGDDQHAEKVLMHARNGFRWAASVGVDVEKLESVGERSAAVVNGREFQGPLYVVRAGRLGEVSVVAIGADEAARFKVAASGELEMAESVEHAEETSAAISPLDKTFEEVRRQRERERRIAEIAASALAANPGMLEYIEKLAQKAIEAEWTPERYELEVLRGLRPRVNATMHDVFGANVDSRAIEAAVCMAAKLPDIEKHYRPEVLEAAAQRWPKGLSIVELLMTFAQRNGYRGSPRDIEPLLRAAFVPREVRGTTGVSNYDLADILSNVANKFLVQGFEAVETSWRSIASIRSVRDFKQISSYSLTGGFEYDEVAPGGELRHATAGDEAYTNQAKTYGKIFLIDRRDIINDDLDALSKVPNRVGRGAALKLNAVFWATFMANSAFFTSARKNFQAGAETALSYEALERAVLLFSKQVDPDGYPLGISPRILLVPVDLEMTARRLVESPVLLALPASTGGSEKSLGATNVFAGRYQVVSSVYLSNTGISGHSARAWYLLADPADLPVIEVAFLNGKDSPTVESADADFNQLGIQLRGYFDFGVALQEYRGGVKMKGEA